VERDRLVVMGVVAVLKPLSLLWTALRRITFACKNLWVTSVDNVLVSIESVRVS
jgi:hypothetical protein